MLPNQRKQPRGEKYVFWILILCWYIWGGDEAIIENITIVHLRITENKTEAKKKKYQNNVFQ